jgi:uncharacterized membrane protein YccC
MTALREAEVEAKVSREEIQAHKYADIFVEMFGCLMCGFIVLHDRTALLAYRAESEQRQQQLIHELENSMRKLRIYEELEAEIDNAVLRAAKQQQSLISTDDYECDANDAAYSQSGQALLRSVRACPSNPERRAKQAVFLAQRLLETERQRDESLEKLRRSDDDLAAAKLEVQ